MPTTPPYALPYPTPTDPADVPADMGELALAVETQLAADDASLAAVDGRLDALEASGIVPQTLVAHIEQTTGLSNVPASTEATANVIVTMPSAIAFTAEPHLIVFFCPSLRPALTLGATLTICLFDGSTALGNLGFLQNPGSGSPRLPMYAAKRLTPTAATHQYSVRAFASGGGLIDAGAGGSGTIMPIFLRITKGPGV